MRAVTRANRIEMMEVREGGGLAGKLEDTHSDSFISLSCELTQKSGAGYIDTTNLLLASVLLWGR